MFMDDEIEKIASDNLNFAFQIHKDLGPGLLESVYEIVFKHELSILGYSVQRQHLVPINYKGIALDEGFRADLIINKCFIVELKSVERLAPVHSKQLLTYMQLLRFPLGLLINFNENLLKDGIKRIIKSKNKYSL